MTGQAREEEEDEVTMMEPFTLRCAQGGLKHTDQGAEPTYCARVITFCANVAEHFISYNIHNGIIGIKHEGKHIKDTKRLRKPKSLKCKWVQYSSWYCCLCSESTPVKCKGTHAPELISRPVNTFVVSLSREHTQVCNLRYVHVFICLY